MIELYRDDDINKLTELAYFSKVNDIFRKAGKVHTIAVEMDGMWENKLMWNYIMRAPEIVVGLHGWTHKDYSLMGYSEICSDIKMSLDYWKAHSNSGYGTLNKEIKTFFPPWNHVSHHLIEACKLFGLKVDSRDCGAVYNFHWWEAATPEGLAEIERRVRA